MSTPAGPSKGIAFTNWLVNKTAGLLETKPSRRGFLIGSAMVGSAVAVAGCAPATQPGSPYNAHHRLRGRPLHRRLHRVLLHDQQRPQRVPARQLRRWLVARRLLQLLQRHPLLHRLHAELLRAQPRERLLRRLHRMPLRRRLQHAPRVLQLLPVRAVPPGDRHHRPHRVPGGHVHAAVRRRVARVHHRARGRQLHRRARARARLHASTSTIRERRRPPVHRRGRASADPAGSAFFGRTADSTVGYREFDRGIVGPHGSTRAGGQLRPRRRRRSARTSTCSGTRHRLQHLGPAPDAVLGPGPVGSRSTATSSPTPQPRATRSAIRVFVRGGGRRDLADQQHSAGVWTGFTSLGGVATSDPVAVGGPVWRLRLRYGAGTTSRLLPAVPAAVRLGLARRSGARRPPIPRRPRTPTGSIVFVRGTRRTLYYRRFSGGRLDPVGEPRRRGQPPTRAWPATRRASTCSYVGTTDAFGTSVGRGDAWSGGRPLGGAAHRVDRWRSPTSTGVYVFVRGSDSALYVPAPLVGHLVGWQSLGGTFAPVRGGR